MMKAAVFEGPGRPLAIKEVPKPEIGDAEMLVRVRRFRGGVRGGGGDAVLRLRGVRRRVEARGGNHRRTRLRVSPRAH